MFKATLRWLVRKSYTQGFATAQNDKKGKNMELRLKKFLPKSEFPEVLEAFREGFRKGWVSRQASKKAA